MTDKFLGLTLPSEVKDRIRKSAKDNHRSMAGEVRRLLDELIKEGRL